MKTKTNIILTFLIGSAFLSMVYAQSSTDPVEAAPSSATQPQCLVFQLFIYGPKPDGKVPSPALNKSELSKTLDEILAAVNNQTGDAKTRQLGFALGPLTLDHTDDQLREIIQGGFALAEKKGLAVAFHTDNSMFWKRRSDLWSVRENIEWTDWNGTPAPDQKIGWLPGAKLAPQMCWNSPKLKQEVGRIARDVIGAEVARGVKHLRSVGKEHLYAGLIAGWETFLHPGTGYQGLSNLGYSATKPPADIDKARATLTHDWLEFYTGELVSGGVPKDRLYTHLPQPTKNPLTVKIGAPPWAAYNANSFAGFSTYDLDKHGPELWADLATRGSPRWACCEGTNIGLQGVTTGDKIRPSTFTWEQYLGSMLAHNTGIINIFAWSDPSPFGMATRSDEAKAAYRKFVKGERLAEIDSPISSILEPLPAKVRRIQQEAPAWVQKTGDQAKADALLRRLDAALKSNNVVEGEKVADEILKLLPAK